MSVSCTGVRLIAARYKRSYFCYCWPRRRYPIKKRERSVHFNYLRSIAVLIIRWFHAVTKTDPSSSRAPRKGNFAGWEKIPERLNPNGQKGKEGYRSLENLSARRLPFYSRRLIGSWASAKLESAQDRRHPKMTNGLEGDWRKIV